MPLAARRLANHGGGYGPPELLARNLFLHHLHRPRTQLVGVCAATLRLLLLWHAPDSRPARSRHAGRAGRRSCSPQCASSAMTSGEQVPLDPKPTTGVPQASLFARGTPVVCALTAGPRLHQSAGAAAASSTSRPRRQSPSGSFCEHVGQQSSHVACDAVPALAIAEQRGKGLQERCQFRSAAREARSTIGVSFTMVHLLCLVACHKFTVSAVG